jgi:DNA-binding transcriptional regulator YdaS (Cro superfamily)
MDLTAYALEKGGTGTLLCPVLAQVAKDAGCSVGTLYMIAKGHKTAGPKLALSVEEATEQRVSRRDLRPDLFGEPEPDDSHRSTAANDGDAAGPQIPPLKAA